MSKDKKRDEFNTYMNQNPNLDEIWLHVMEAAQSFEEELGFSRREVCEGFVFGTISLIKRRADCPKMTPLEEVYDFLDWMIKWAEIRKEQLPSIKAEKRFLKDHNMTQSDARDFGWKQTPEKTSH